MAKKAFFIWKVKISIKFYRLNFFKKHKLIYVATVMSMH